MANPSNGQLLDFILNRIQTFEESLTISRIPGVLELIKKTGFGEQ